MEINVHMGGPFSLSHSIHAVLLQLQKHLKKLIEQLCSKHCKSERNNPSSNAITGETE